MKLKTLYEEIIKKGIDADVRDKREIEKILKERLQAYEKSSVQEKKFFDQETLNNPFADTRILWGASDVDIRSMMVGIDIDGSELVVAQQLKSNGTGIDLVIGHHPAGRAYANFYNVMDLQVDMFMQEGISVSVAENLLAVRKSEVARRVHAANHQRSVDCARLLGINFLCMHTPCDNLAHQYVCGLVKKEKPATLGSILDLLLALPEYHDAASNNNAPEIVIGNRNSRAARIHVEFTGGTEGPQGIYQRLSGIGVDTVIAMHQSEEHYKKCKEENINVIFASHIASDALGINLMLDYLETKAKFKIYECSGFRRFGRKHK
ncbi:MAG: NGG1p interacting factor NIF3 [Candidatus Omnitrophota bacterium]